jgi:hypothetical protein
MALTLEYTLRCAHAAVKNICENCVCEVTRGLTTSRERPGLKGKARALPVAKVVPLSWSRDPYLSSGTGVL